MDHEVAVKWYRMAAEQGLTDAQCRLGLMYALDLGVPESPAKALEWLRMAAEEGYPEAQFYVGHAYTFGKDVPENIPEGLKGSEWQLTRDSQKHSSIWGKHTKAYMSLLQKDFWDFRILTRYGRES